MMQGETIKRKFCKLCEKNLPWTPTYFHYWHKSSGRLHHYCKPCKIAYVMSWKHGGSFKKIERQKKIIRSKIVVTKKQAIAKKLEIKPKVQIERKTITAKPIPPKEPKNRPVRVKDLRKDCRKAISLFLSDRISTTDLFKRLKRFYGAGTKVVVDRLRRRLGLPSNLTPS